MNGFAWAKPQAIPLSKFPGTGATKGRNLLVEKSEECDDRHVEDDEGNIFNFISDDEA